MTLKYHDPKEHPRCATCLLAETDKVRLECHLAEANFSNRSLKREPDWFCEKGLWWVRTGPLQEPELPPSKGETWEFTQIEYRVDMPPFGFDATIRFHEQATREGE